MISVKSKRGETIQRQKESRIKRKQKDIKTYRQNKFPNKATQTTIWTSRTTKIHSGALYTYEGIGRFCSSCTSGDTCVRVRKYFDDS